MATFSRVNRYALLLICLLSTSMIRGQDAGLPQAGSPPSDLPPGPPPPFRIPQKGDPGPPHDRRTGIASGVSDDTAHPPNLMRKGLQLGPPGRWWDDAEFARRLGLSAQQQQKMDTIFEQNRATVLTRYQSYKQEQAQLETLAHAKELDESALMSGIERLGHARTALEQANTHTLLQIRTLMSADQIFRLDSHP